MDSMTWGTVQHDAGEVLTIGVKLSGEFDVRYEKALRDILSRCVATERPAFVDLSEVTFMDSLCVRELAIQYQVGDGRLALCNPSQEVELSVVACELQEWIDFVYTTAPGPLARRRCGKRHP